VTLVTELTEQNPQHAPELQIAAHCSAVAVPSAEMQPRGTMP
jgi:hypothetical protein